MPFKPTDFTQVNPHINRVLVSRALAPAGRAAGRARDRLVLRPRQFHAAARHAGRARCWASRAAKRWWRAPAKTTSATSRRRGPGRALGTDRLRGAQPVRDDAAAAGRRRRCRHAGWSIRRAKAPSRWPRRWPTCTSSPSCARRLDAAAAHRLRELQSGDAGARRRAAGAPGGLPLHGRGRGQHVPAHGACGDHGGVRHEA